MAEKARRDMKICKNYENCKKIKIFVKFAAEQNIVKITVELNRGHT